MALTPEQADKNRLCLALPRRGQLAQIRVRTYFGQIVHKGLDEYKDPKVHQGITPKVARATRAGAANERPR